MVMRCYAGGWGRGGGDPRGAPVLLRRRGGAVGVGVTPPRGVLVLLRCGWGGGRCDEHRASCVLANDTNGRMGCTMQFSQRRIFYHKQRWTVNRIHNNSIQTRFRTYNPACYTRLNRPPTPQPCELTVVIGTLTHHAVVNGAASSWRHGDCSKHQTGHVCRRYIVQNAHSGSSSTQGI